MRNGNSLRHVLKDWKEVRSGVKYRVLKETGSFYINFAHFFPIFCAILDRWTRVLEPRSHDGGACASRRLRIQSSTTRFRRWIPPTAAAEMTFTSGGKPQDRKSISKRAEREKSRDWSRSERWKAGCGAANNGDYLPARLKSVLRARAGLKFDYPKCDRKLCLWKAMGKETGGLVCKRLKATCGDE